MRVYLRELTDDPKELHFSEQDAWVIEAIKDTEEADLEKRPACSVDFELRKLQDVVFLKGKIKVHLGLICSRCANGIAHPLSANFQAMFTREKSLGETNTNVGVAHSEPTGATGEDLDIELLEKDYIELGDVLKEQIYLKIPFQPLCNEGCKGVCPVCGQDKNTHPCQCHRIKNTALANALKNFKVS